MSKGGYMGSQRPGGLMKVQAAYVREHGDIKEYRRILGIKG